MLPAKMESKSNNVKANNRQALVCLHLSVLLAGFTGLFGRLVSLPETGIVFWRLLFTVLILIVFTGLPRIPFRKMFQIMACGAVLSFHWLLFYGSIKMSNASVGALCMASAGFFSALIEPIVFHRRISWCELLFALIALCGLLCIFSFDSRYRLGVIVGIVSAFVCSLYTVMNKVVNRDVRSRTMLVYQMLGGLIGVVLIIPLYLRVFPSGSPMFEVPVGADLWWLLCLSLFCTVGLYLLQILSLKRLSAFTVNLSYNLEPCYTILIAFIFLGEGREVNFSFYLGLSLVVLSVAMQCWRQLK